MKKLLFVISVVCFPFLAFSQKKFELKAKSGYAGIENGKQDGILTSLSVGYLVHQKIGLFIGFTSLRNNTFPNGNGEMKTGTFFLAIQNSDNKFHDAVLNHYTDGAVNNYFSFSSLSFDFGVEYSLLQSAKNDLSIVAKGLYANQIKHHFFPEEISNTEVTITSSVNNFSGIGFSPELQYSRKLYKSFFLGSYIGITMLPSNFSTDYFDLGLFISVAL